MTFTNLVLIIALLLATNMLSYTLATLRVKGKLEDILAK